MVKRFFKQELLEVASECVRVAMVCAEDTKVSEEVHSQGGRQKSVRESQREAWSYHCGMGYEEES